MAFILSGATVISYAEALDVRDKDQRITEANEIDFTNVPDTPGSLDNYIEDLTTKATGRINAKIKASSRWKEYLAYTGTSFDINTVPAFVPERIVARKADFTDMCAYATLYMYLLPKVADFGNPESNEVQKIQYYESKFNDIFNELLAMADWYDADGDGTVEDSEKAWNYATLRRTRRRATVVKVR